MKKIFSVLLILCLFSSIYAIEPIDETVVQEGLNEFVTGLADSAPALTSMTNVWADAYVGQLIALPPSIGLGGSAGVSKLDIRGIKKAATELGIHAVDKLKDDFVLPVVSVDAVLGGLLIPFDISGSYMKLKDPVGISGDNALQYRFDVVSAKLRVPLLKQNIILPNLALGVGFSRVSGDFLVKLDETFLNATFKSDVFSADLQLSKSVIFLTPYIGARVLVSKSENTWEYNYNVQDILKNDAKGTFVTDPEKKDIDYQLFAGTSFNILVIKLNVNVAYDIKTKLWAGGIGAHVVL